jgi:hypothetical protein
MTDCVKETGSTAGASEVTCWDVRSSITGEKPCSSFIIMSISDTLRLLSKGSTHQETSSGTTPTEISSINTLPMGAKRQAPKSLYVWEPNIPLAFVTARMEDAGKLMIALPDVEAAKPADFQSVEATARVPERSKVEAQRERVQTGLIRWICFAFKSPVARENVGCVTRIH